MSAMLKQKLIDIANGFTKYGLWKGGGSGGSSALSDMTDVTFTDLQVNDVLKYNGSVWINGDNLHEYSTEEKVVGKWIDGKPIYEKTLIYNNQYLASGFTDLEHGISNIDMYIDLKGNYKNLENSNLLLLSHLNTNGFGASIGAWCENKTQIRISTGSIIAANYNIYLTIQYTKTTD